MAIAVLAGFVPAARLFDPGLVGDPALIGRLAGAPDSACEGDRRLAGAPGFAGSGDRFAPDL
jgi:hypothetical protein